NLVGSTMSGIDLAGATLRGATIGESESIGVSQPSDCSPETYFVCRRFLEYRAACPWEGNSSLIDQPVCERGFTPGVSQRALAQSCLLAQWDGQHCVEDEGACEQAVPETLAIEVNCTWDGLHDAGEAACAWGEQTFVQPECTATRTTLHDVRLDGANLVGAVLDRIELTDSPARGANLAGATFIEVVVDAVDLTGASLRGADLSRMDLSGETLVDADLRGASLRQADLRDADLTGANLTDADLTGAAIERTLLPTVLRRVRLFAVNAAEVSWAGALLDDAVIEQSYFRGDFEGARLDGARVHAVNFDARGVNSMRGATFRDTDLVGVRIGGDTDDADFSGALVDGLTLGLGEGVGASATDVSFVNVSGQRLSVASVDLTGADFLGADLSDADFSGADLTEVRFQNAVVRQSRFTGAAFTRTCLRNAGLPGSNLDESVFDGVALNDVDLTGASLVSADLRGACGVSAAELRRADLDGARICDSFRAALEARDDTFGTPTFEACATVAQCDTTCR
ncbi:MAG: pentapeptide repeat-containing protein, partial [Myxococcales bacterium]|nr:pentapeptide repeat-containing protein [Myxococcales bacterium]